MALINVSVPGRICLFGEHQDYLNLPVITSAINRRITISGAKTDDRTFSLNLPDISKTESFKLPEEGNLLPYKEERDYFRSSVNVLLKQGIQLKNGCECTVRGTIPINSGTSSAVKFANSKFPAACLIAETAFNTPSLTLCKICFVCLG